MHLAPHSPRTRDPITVALGESDRARVWLQAQWMRFEAEPTPEHRVELFSAMGAEVDSLLRLEVARRLARGKP